MAAAGAVHTEEALIFPKAAFVWRSAYYTGGIDNNTVGRRRYGAAFLIPIGLFLIFTKEMCITNKFYWQEGRRRGRSGRA